MAQLTLKPSDSDEQTYRKLAEELKYGTVQEWIIETLNARAAQIQKWLEKGDYIELTDGRKIFPDQVVSKPKGK